jgi:phosphate transport system permease protein
MMYAVVKNLILSLLVLLVMSLFVVLADQSAPAWHTFGLAFLYRSDWNPGLSMFGALSAIVGTLVSAFLAILIAAPMGLVIAFIIQEYLPRCMKKSVRLAMDLCMGIPSIVYGIWAMFVLIPICGIGLFTAGVVLAVMILPMIIALMTDLISQVPPQIREAAYGVGAYKSELLGIYCRQLKKAFWGTMILALARALGETMAVSFVLGNSHRLTLSLFAPATTLSAAIAGEFGEAFSGLYPASLYALGLILLLLSFGMILLARILLKQEV